MSLVIWPWPESRYRKVKLPDRWRVKKAARLLKRCRNRQAIEYLEELVNKEEGQNGQAEA